jgi:DNA-binding XRE family transcriptional regulator
VDGEYFDMCSDLGGSSNWLQPRPPLQAIPTQLAEKINAKQKSISRCETGASLPSMKTLVKIAKVLKEPAGYFLDE